MKTVVEEIIREFNTQFDKQKFLDWFNKNKEALVQKEKQHLIDFSNDLLAQNDINYIAKPDLAEQYYNETFKND